MSKLESLQEIKDTAMRLLEVFVADDTESTDASETALYQLIDRFYLENKDMMISEQYEAAKRDIKYFMALVEMAIAYHQEEEHKRLS